MTEKNGNQNNKTNTATRDRLLRYSAFLGSSGVSLGAFGAHALKQMMVASSLDVSRVSSLQDNWRTAVQYQLFHAVALLALSSLAQNDVENAKSHHTISSSRHENIKDNSSQSSTIRSVDKIDMSGKMMFYGTMLFSGSIYCLTLGIGPKKILGPITPLGGLFMIGGWIVVGMITIS